MYSYQRRTFTRDDRKERARIEALLVEFQRSLEVIKAEIEIEERRTMWPSSQDPRCPARLHILRTRHDNLIATIRVLKDRAGEVMESAV